MGVVASTSFQAIPKPSPSTLVYQPNILVPTAKSKKKKTVGGQTSAFRLQKEASSRRLNASISVILRVPPLSRFFCLPLPALPLSLCTSTRTRACVCVK